jgi:hypothetical protein
MICERSGTLLAHSVVENACIHQLIRKERLFGRELEQQLTGTLSSSGGQQEEEEEEEEERCQEQKEVRS